MDIVHMVTRLVLQQVYVKEIYHPDYVAKRMEIGAVMGAAPRRAVQRLNIRSGRYYHTY